MGAIRGVGEGLAVAVGVADAGAVGVAVAVGVGVGDGLAQGGISYVFETFPGGGSPAALQKSCVKNPAPLFP